MPATLSLLKRLIFVSGGLVDGSTSCNAGGSVGMHCECPPAEAAMLQSLHSFDMRCQFC